MSNFKSKDGKTLVSFRSNPKDMETFASITHGQYGHGGVSLVLNALIKEYIQTHDGKYSKLDSFLDPNFTPKPMAFDDLEKVVTPFMMQLSDQELHRLRVWAFQTHTICTAYSKIPVQRRKVTRMTYDECIEIIRKFENGT
jgi:hypothetical protein